MMGRSGQPQVSAAAGTPALRPEDEVARLRQRCDELERANKAKDRMLAVLGHDLRAPLTAILGWTSRLRREDLNGAQTARALETIERNARAQQKLIEQVMEASRVAADRLQMVLAPIDLGLVVDTVVEGFLPAAGERRVRLVCHAIDGVTVLADRARIEQVVTNLIGNALKYTEAGGHVTVTVKRENKKACLVVHDDGQGIEAALLPRVFDLWVQDDSAPVAKSGLGLGLHIVKNIVERHRGTVSAESEGPGAGATFKVRLDLYAGTVSGTRAKHKP